MERQLPLDLADVIYRRDPHISSKHALGRIARRIAVLAGVALLALALAGPASAERAPCWKRLINDWYYDGRIDKAYPVKCYRETIKNLPEDVQAYSSAREDISRALAAAISGRGGKLGPDALIRPDRGRPLRDGGRQRSPYEIDPTSAEEEEDDEEDPGPIGDALGWLGPDRADAVPLPILILSGIALLLLAAAGASFVARRLQTRRVPVVTTPRDPS